MCSTAERVPLDRLEREICELAGHIAAATCRWLSLLAEWDERRGWAEWGVKSCAHWLSWRCSIGLVAAREHMRVAHRLRELPLVREAFGKGELSYCKVRAITRIATPELEAHLVELARHATGAQLEKLVRGYSRAVRATVEQAREAHERRGLTWCYDHDGSFLLQARLPADEGALVISALGTAEGWPPYGPAPEEIGAQAPVGGTVPARRADALVSLARAAMAAGGAERVSGDRCDLVVHVDARSLVGDRIDACSEVQGGPTLPAETARRLGCDAAVVRIIERDGRPLSVGRRTRSIPPALRRALRRRDDGCRFPGCTHRRFLHAHHIQHWARGGATNLDNLVQLCSYHHRLVHEGGYQVERAGPRAWRFRRPDGREIPAAGRGRQPTGPGLAHQHRARGLAIDAETCKAKSAGDKLDYDIAVEGLCAMAHAPP
jgi:5-methylcytosine-specific restriction endonuclease McrA